MKPTGVRVVACAVFDAPAPAVTLVARTILLLVGTMLDDGDDEFTLLDEGWTVTRHPKGMAESIGSSGMSGRSNARQEKARRQSAPAAGPQDASWKGLKMTSAAIRAS
jgi:hypothetical protein